MIGEINFAAICLDDGTVFGRKPFIGLFFMELYKRDMINLWPFERRA